MNASHVTCVSVGRGTPKHLHGCATDVKNNRGETPLPTCDDGTGFHNFLLNHECDSQPPRRCAPATGCLRHTPHACRTERPSKVFLLNCSPQNPPLPAHTKKETKVDTSIATMSRRCPCKQTSARVLPVRGNSLFINIFMSLFSISFYEMHPTLDLQDGVVSISSAVEASRRNCSVAVERQRSHPHQLPSTPPPHPCSRTNLFTLQTHTVGDTCRDVSVARPPRKASQRPLFFVGLFPLLNLCLS